MYRMWCTALGSFLLSIVGRVLADRFVSNTPLWIIPRHIGFQFTQNPGVAFGLILPGFSPLVIVVLILIAFFLVLVIALRSPRRVWSDLGFGFILGGGFANLIDRLGDGLVTDFIILWIIPTFNIADFCITLGVTALCIDIVTHRSRGSVQSPSHGHSL